MSNAAASPKSTDDTLAWDDESLWSEPAAAQRFSFGGRSPRDVAVSVALVLLTFASLLVVLAFVSSGDAGATGGGG